MSRLQLPLKRRYLVRFDPKRVPHLFADVLIIGGGIAGIRAALAVDPRLTTIVVTKDALDQSNSAYAQGGTFESLSTVYDIHQRPARQSFFVGSDDGVKGKRVSSSIATSSILYSATSLPFDSCS